MSTSWFKSTFSSDVQTCVEVSHRLTTVLIRDSKYTGPATDQPVIAVKATHWPAFLQLALNKESGQLSDDIAMTVESGGSATLADRNTVLSYTADEWDAFTKGIASGQFDRPTEFQS